MIFFFFSSKLHLKSDLLRYRWFNNNIVYPSLFTSTNRNGKRSSEICSYCACLQEKYLFINIRNTFTNIFEIPCIQSSVALQYFQFRHAAAECLLFRWYEKLIWYCFCILLTRWNFLHHQIYLINIYFSFHCFLNIFMDEYHLAMTFVVFKEKMNVGKCDVIKMNMTKKG